MQIQYFTYFLNPLSNPSFFPDNRPKKEIFREVLKQKSLKYKASGSDLAYVFEKEDGDYIVAKLGKKQSLKRSLPPEDGFEETIDENWPHCLVFFNLDEDPNTGQKIAFEYKSNIFKTPLVQLQDLANELNIALFSSNYAVAVHPIIEERKFWDIVKENEGKIEKVTFSFNAPNLFNLKNNLNDDLKNAQQKFGLTKATVEFENPQGKLTLSDEDEFLKQGVEYVRKGGGDFHLKLKNGKRTVVRSEDGVMTKTVDEYEDMEARIKFDNAEVMNSAIKNIFDKIKE